MERVELRVTNPSKAVEKFLNSKEVKKAFVIDANSIVVFFKSKSINKKNLTPKNANA